MNSDETKNYHHQNLKEALIKEAFVIIKNEGIDALTLRSLTQGLGASRSAIYRHFANKEDLIKNVILAGFEELDIQFEPIFLNETISTIEKLEQMGAKYIDFAVNNPDLYRMLFGPKHKKEREEVCADEKPDLYRLKNNQSNVNELDEMESNGFHKLVVLIVKAQEEGLFIKEEPFIISITIWSTLHGLASLIIDGHAFGEFLPQTLYQASLNSLLKGLQT